MVMSHMVLFASAQPIVAGAAAVAGSYGDSNSAVAAGESSGTGTAQGTSDMNDGGMQTNVLASGDSSVVNGLPIAVCTHPLAAKVILQRYQRKVLRERRHRSHSA